ncbi:MAG TPA: thiamine phosphate synthase [Burkholderiales bacterium]|nr:thiamine phosphate synthase [Burkholderiales bacterium]
MHEKLDQSLVAGLYAVTPDLSDTALLLAKTQAALVGGARLVQYRSKIADGNLRREQATALRELCRRRGTPLIINDDVDLAREIDADGVHVGADDAAVAIARAQIGGEKIIGVSCYNDLPRALFAAAQGADYVAFGSFFASSIKPGAVRAPLALLQQARQQIRLPLVAIGGITLDNASGPIGAGADAVAVIAALFAAPDVEAAARKFCRLFAVKAA